jgi:hypothetical protein
MVRHITIGVSAAALAAATASAQTSTDSQGNWQSLNCSPSNSCQIKNGKAFNSTNDGNRAQINVSGTGNDVEISQIFDKNSASIVVNGNGNNGRIRQRGEAHSARLEQKGNSNGAVIHQNDRGNSATVQQTSTPGAAAGNTLLGKPSDVNFSLVTQGSYNSAQLPELDIGERNIAISIQNGSALESEIQQRGSETAPADDNRATVTQSGSGSFSTVAQFSRGNVALVYMGEGGREATNSRNYSEIIQSNVAFRGTASGGFVTGQGLPDESVAFGNPMSGNIADVSIVGRQQRSIIEQSGVQNRAMISLSGGRPGDTDDDIAAGRVNPATGGALPEHRGYGNFVNLLQSGRGSSTDVSTGRDRRITLASEWLNDRAGAGNRVYVEQSQQNADFGGSPNAAVNSEAHRAFVHQRGTLDSVVSYQRNNKVGSATQSGSIADVAQMSFNSTTSISQTGSNTARVTQGVNRLEIGGNNLTEVNQVDAGGADARNNADVAQYGTSNLANVDQDAVNASAVIFQKIGSRANLADVDQGTGAALGYFNSASGGSQQIAAGTGTGAAAVNLTASITQSNRGGKAAIYQDGSNLSAVADQSGTNPAAASNNNSLLIAQMGSWNAADLLQSGFNHQAVIEQQGIGESALRNGARIDQAGDSHSATIRQTATVRPTQSCATASNCPAAGNPNDPAFPNARAAGTRYAAEAVIIQRGTFGGGDGNDAAIEQRGVGQYARIEQYGSNNNAGIIQDRNATNAVAILIQNGNNNSYYINQQSPGQYLRVVQKGNGHFMSYTAGASAGHTSDTSMGDAGGTFRGPKPGF